MTAARPASRIRPVLSLLCLAALAGPPAVGAEPGPVVVERQFADWTLRCEDATCWIYDNAPREDLPHSPFAMTIGVGVPAAAYRVLVHTAKAPRLMRKRGIELYVDGRKAGNLVFAQCGNPDCVFLADYAPAQIRSIAAAHSLALLAPDAMQLQGVATEVSADGLREAFRAFRATAAPELLPAEPKRR